MSVARVLYARMCWRATQKAVKISAGRRLEAVELVVIGVPPLDAPPDHSTTDMGLDSPTLGGDEEDVMLVYPERAANASREIVLSLWSWRESESGDEAKKAKLSAVDGLMDHLSVTKRT